MLLVAFDVIFHLLALLLQMLGNLFVDVFKKLHWIRLQLLFGFLKLLHDLLAGGLDSRQFLFVITIVCSVDRIQIISGPLSTELAHRLANIQPTLERKQDDNETTIVVSAPSSMSFRRPLSTKSAIPNNCEVVQLGDLLYPRKPLHPLSSKRSIGIIKYSE